MSLTKVGHLWDNKGRMIEGGKVMKVKVVKGIVCPECDEFILKDDIPEVEERYQCGECEEIYEDRDEAKECCKD